MTPNNLVSLQALRAGAAISVSLVHLNLISVMLQGGSNERATLYPLASGVDLFFVISGFIMVYSSGQLFGKSDSLYIFFMRRIARVVPIYWLTMSIDLFLERKPLSLTNLFGSYFFVPFMESDGSIVPLYGVGWTLNFEMFFYCVFSIMIMFRRSIAILGVSTVLFSMMVLENLLQTPPIPVIFWSDPIVFEFIFGMLLAVIYRRGIRLPLPICLAMIVAGVCAVWWPSPSMPPLGWWVSPSGSRFLFWGIPATMVVAGAILQRRSLPFAVPRPIEILGNASYSVYLVHILVFNSILILWPYGLNTFPIGSARLDAHWHMCRSRRHVRATPVTPNRASPWSRFWSRWSSSPWWRLWRLSAWDRCSRRALASGPTSTNLRKPRSSPIGFARPRGAVR